MPPVVPLVPCGLRVVSACSLLKVEPSTYILRLTGKGQIQNFTEGIIVKDYTQNKEKNLKNSHANFHISKDGGAHVATAFLQGRLL